MSPPNCVVHDATDLGYVCGGNLFTLKGLTILTLTYFDARMHTAQLSEDLDDSSLSEVAGYK